MKMRLAFSVLMITLSTFLVLGAETDSVKLSKNPEINKYLKQPIKPSSYTDEAAVIENPTVKEYRLKSIKDKPVGEVQPLELDFNSEIIPEDLKPREIYNASPYARDWANKGVIMRNDNGYLAGYGNYNTMLGMGSIGNAGISYTQNWDKFTVQGGAFGSKMNINGYRFNTFGVNGMITYDINEWLSINAYGSYSPNSQYLGMAALPYMGATNFGGTLTIKASEKVGIDLGVERYYDTYSREWKTRPVVAPYVFLGSNKVVVDFGWLIDGLINTRSNSAVIGPPITPMPPPR